MDIEKGEQIFAILEKMDRRSRRIDQNAAFELARNTPDKKVLDELNIRNKLWLGRMHRINELMDKMLR